MFQSSGPSVGSNVKFIFWEMPAPIILPRKSSGYFQEAGITPDCSVKKDLYLNTWASNYDLINWTFAAECGYNNGYYHCHSQYHHREEWYED
jgi:hypothetical protein